MFASFTASNIPDDDLMITSCNASPTFLPNSQNQFKPANRGGKKSIIFSVNGETKKIEI